MTLFLKMMILLEKYICLYRTQGFFFSIQRKNFVIFSKGIKCYIDWFPS